MNKPKQIKLIKTIHPGTELELLLLAVMLEHGKITYEEFQASREALLQEPRKTVIEIKQYEYRSH